MAEGGTMTTGGQPETRNLAYYINCFSQIQVYKNNKKGGEALNQLFYYYL